MSNPTSPALRRALLATLVLCMVGCKDLKIQTQGDSDEFRFGQPNEMWLTYKKDVIEPGTSGVTVSWKSDKQGHLSDEVRLDLSTLRPGKHKITATCKHESKKGKESKKTKKIEILNDRPQPTINGPGAQASFGVGKTVVMQGAATDREDGEVPSSSLNWSISGPSGTQNLGSGDTAEASDLRPGLYTITLTATDRAGATAQATRLFEVTNQAPEVTLSAPTGTVAPINVLDSIDVAASATDPDPVHGSASITEIKWTSNLHPGQTLATGRNATLSNLNGGVHTISAVAYDEFGAAGRASFNLTVNNEDPEVRILAPNSQSFFSAAATITFEAQATDAEAAIDPNKVEWAIANGGNLKVFGRGLSYSTDALEPGTHTIRCTVTDAHNGSAFDEITVLVKNEKPEPVIVRPGPLNTRTFHYGDRIRLVGEATDEEDGQVADSGMTWNYRKVDGSNAGKTGQLRQSGGSISVEAERLVKRNGFGTYEITLTAKDSDGAEETSQSRSFKIENQRAEVRLTAPTQGATFVAGQPVRLTAVATDPDTSGFLGGDQFQWMAKDLATGERIELGKGDNVQTSKLTAAGRYQIVVVVTDPQDEDTKVRATTRIEITPAPVAQPTAGADGNTPGIAPSVSNN